MLLPLGCVQPEYPDEFEETARPSLASDASAALPVLEAGPEAVPDSAAEPGAWTAPESGVVPSWDAGAQSGGSFDAGSVAPATQDAGARPPQVDASTPSDNDRDARAPEKEVEDASTATGPTSCMITASTDASNAFPYAGKYGCAVWIGDASKKVVKAFFVGTRIASRSGLSTYRSAVSGVTVDVVTGATLNVPKQHMYTWDLKTSAGAPAAPGNYTLNVETHSSNGDKTVSVPFILGAGSVTAMATPAGDVRAASIRCE